MVQIDYAYRHLHKAAQKMIELANGREPYNELEYRALNQAARELLMAQTSCWEFIMYYWNNGWLCSQENK